MPTNFWQELDHRYRSDYEDIERALGLNRTQINPCDEIGFVPGRTIDRNQEITKFLANEEAFVYCSVSLSNKLHHIILVKRIKNRLSVWAVNEDILLGKVQISNDSYQTELAANEFVAYDTEFINYLLRMGLIEKGDGYSPNKRILRLTSRYEH